ncbi:hypothetical protein F0562_035575 [Nyssa sinensis]|uniref:Leucine-rich repeat-containing N-terminal plant-type domain-containing protein n=1 Tax=Nyssa sinensis TaxID=561372 RepID=A0A5J5AD67_9ASTE|nr:hypothetical protein F0562_035575 [Nyssa sinensis]
MRNPIILCCFLWLCIIFIEVSGQCLEEQRSLLIQLKKELSVDYSTKSKLESWSLTTDCCSWDGVACKHQTGHVIRLDLSSSSINGEFNSSSSLFSLRYLQQLNLANNSFYPSPLPMGLQQLLSLTHLNVSGSSFVGQVPLEISFLTRLVSLDLSNHFGYPMMLESPDLKGLIRNLTDLRELYLDGIQISLTGSEWSKVLSLALPNLSVLSMSGCNLSGPIHPSLSQLKFLTHLNLARNNLISIVPDFLANFSYLISLQLCSCNLYGRFPENIFLIPTLRILEICTNPQLTGSLPKFPPGTTLEVIRLSNMDFSGKLPDSISNIAFLRNLQIDDCSFIGSITSSFQNLTELVYLDLSWNNFSGLIPSLASSKKITGLILSNNGFTGTIPSSYGNDLKNLEILNLRNNLLQGMIPSSLFTIPSIKLIALSGNRFSGQLQEFQNASSSFLREIDLSQNELQGPIPNSIFKIRSLNHLSLSSNHFNGTIGVGMFDDFKHLAGLDLSDNNLSFNVSGSNSKTLPYISRLRLGSCNIFEFPNFLRNQIHLFHLDLSNNRIGGALPNWGSRGWMLVAKQIEPLEI